MSKLWPIWPITSYSNYMLKLKELCLKSIQPALTLFSVIKPQQIYTMFNLQLQTLLWLKSHSHTSRWRASDCPFTTVYTDFHVC